LSAFHPISPLRSIELVEAAGIPDGRRVIADFAAAGLIRSYALTIETIEVSGVASAVRDSALTPALWQRIIREDVAEDVWTGGTVRLRPAELIGGEPEVRITGVRFSEKYLQRLVDHHLGSVAKALPPRKTKPVLAEAVDPQPIPSAPVASKPAPAPIPPGALWVTVKEAQQITGFGRTKINELMNDGRFVRRRVDSAVRIEVASIKALLGEGA
jgi:hypothetical protein